MSVDLAESMEQQLRSLYEEREFLHERFGVSSAEDVVNMVECLEAQLRDFYGRFGSVDAGDTEQTLLLSHIKSLSSALDPMYSEKSVSFSFEDDRPVLRAQWTEQLNNQGE